MTRVALDSEYIKYSQYMKEMKKWYKRCGRALTSNCDFLTLSNLDSSYLDICV